MTEVTNILEATPPQWEAKDINFETLDSTATRKLKGLPDVKKFSIKLLHNAANYALLTTLIANNAGANIYYRYNFSDGKGHSWIGYLSNYGFEKASNSDPAALMLEITVDGDLTAYP